MMKTLYSPDPEKYQRMTTDEIREAFLIDNLFKSDRIEFVYSDVDRVIIGSAVPESSPLKLSDSSAADEIRADYFCKRREMGVINIGSTGTVTVDGEKYELENRDALYIGRGSQEVTFECSNKSEPAKFYLVSYPAHCEYPCAKVSKSDVKPAELGSEEKSNRRSLYKMIQPDNMQSCQLVMGFTEIKGNSVWNTMPPHTHGRRMEAYLYFEVSDSDRVFHFMGPADETRHIVVANHQALLSPSWSIHSGAGTGSYSFCWAMGGENQDFDDMDHIKIGDLK